MKFENEKIAYNSVTVKMNDGILKEAVAAFKEVHYGEKTSAECPDEKILTQELQEDLLSELDNLLEYEDNLEKVLIGLSGDDQDCSKFIELKLKHELKDEFEHEVVVEECILVHQD